MTPADRVPRPPRWRPAVLAWGLWALAVLCLALIGWFDRLLRQAGRADLVQLNASGVAYLLGVLSAATVGALVAGRRPRHPVGWLLLALGTSVAVDGVVSGYAIYGAVARPGSLPGARPLAVYAESITLAARVCLGFVLLLTPTGSLPSPRWRWWARVMAVTPVIWLVAKALVPRPLYPPFQSVANPFAVEVLAGPLRAVWAAAAIVLNAGLVVAFASLLVRFRRARGLERQQLRWVALAAALSGMLLVTALTGQALAYDAVVTWATGVLLAILPLAIGAAVAGATLVVAALFQPARRRIQALVDRRFNRRRYDAARTVEGFAARLRDQIDLQALHRELLAVVDQTMAPTQASLWLRAPRPRG